jgi:hypothetical protein
MVEYILCYGGPAEHWGPLPATRLASRKILFEQYIKKRTGPSVGSTVEPLQAAALGGRGASIAPAHNLAEPGTHRELSGAGGLVNMASSKWGTTDTIL